ncbi:MAG: DUF1905 domain-containing protein [Chitinophagaceae bacterium]|nr:MAG: DUF1905 domain-containing protein [Chitinophagaceae bacterium]
MKLAFKATLEKFGSMGEKTGWTYIAIPPGVSRKLSPENKKSFRVKGTLDSYAINGVALIPIGEGNFIMPVNGVMRKALKKVVGASVEATLEIDTATIPISAELLECLTDEPKAQKIFTALLPSHQQYYSKWIESAKTEATKTKRIGIVINGLARGLDFGAMFREERDKKIIR